MRCLVTGASGFLGSHLVRELLARQHSVVILLRSGAHTERLQDCLPRVSVVRGSLEDTAELQRILKHEPVDASFHVAWAGVTGEYRNSIDQVTCNVTRSLELWHVLHNAGCKILVGVGSQAEYGSYPGVLCEDMPTTPVTAYGSAKLALGILLKQLCAIAGMRFVWLRLFSAYGPGDDERHMVPGLIRTLMRREKPPLTLGEQIWDYLYVTDVVNALCASLESEAAGVFNLGSGKPCVLRDFILKVRDSIDPTLPLGFGEVAYRCDQVMNLTADIGRLKAATGWSPEVSLPEGIRRTVEWYREQGATHAVNS
jgi:nucleoside-diphosphate-sugar epimerase